MTRFVSCMQSSLPYRVTLFGLWYSTKVGTISLPLPETVVIVPRFVVEGGGILRAPNFEKFIKIPRNRYDDQTPTKRLISVHRILENYEKKMCYHF